MTLPSGITALLALLPVVVTLLGAYLAALWFCLVIWTFRDIQKRSNDVLVQILATVLVLLFNLPGLLLYTILRPPETLAEVYGRSLEEDALTRDIQQSSCPTCKQPVQPDFVICPACHTSLGRHCPTCQRFLQNAWDICPYCGRA